MFQFFRKSGNFEGRCACELSAFDELLLTEMLYGGVFTDLTPAQIAALLSCFVFQLCNNSFII